MAMAMEMEMEMEMVMVTVTVHPKYACVSRLFLCSIAVFHDVLRPCVAAWAIK